MKEGVFIAQTDVGDPTGPVFNGDYRYYRLPDNRKAHSGGA